ncbi:trypsin-like serine protease [Pontiellaceae bacterium B1224]|nr:trypsin-like serine protease [Pontiellaceae bacterium B1224]
MGCWLVKLSVAALLLTGMAGRASAIAVDDYTVAETNPALAGYSLNWDSIYNYKGSSAVAVDHYWILTAAHVADDDSGKTNLTINGDVYIQQEIVFHASADLALVRYDKPLPGYYALHSGEIYTGSGRSRSYKELLLAGYGYKGAVSSSSFTQTDEQWVKRWGTNRGNGETTDSVDVGGTSGTVTTKCFEMPFNLNDTDYEAGGNIYDSGGPVFIEDESEWKLTGINLYRYGSSDTMFFENRAAMIHDYIDWIKSVIVDYDTSMNGLPDWWEAEHSVSDAEDDPDADGFTNYEEWIANTDPNLGTSYLAVSAYTNAVKLTFESSEDRKYCVEFCDALTNQNWAVEVDWFDGSVSQTTQSVSNTDSNRFYRIRARLH